MNEQLETALAELIQKTLSGVDSVVGFGQEQLPEVVRQLILYNIWASAVWLAVCATITAAIARLFIHCWRECEPDGGFACILAIIPAFGFTVGHAIGLAKITLAPKVWLLEYAAGLAK